MSEQALAFGGYVVLATFDHWRYRHDSELISIATSDGDPPEVGALLYYEGIWWKAVRVKPSPVGRLVTFEEVTE